MRQSEREVSKRLREKVSALEDQLTKLKEPLTPINLIVEKFESQFLRLTKKLEVDLRKAWCRE